MTSVYCGLLCTVCGDEHVLCCVQCVVTSTCCVVYSVWWRVRAVGVRDPGGDYPPLLALRGWLHVPGPDRPSPLPYQVGGCDFNSVKISLQNQPFLLARCRMDTRRQKTWALKIELLHLRRWINSPGHKLSDFPLGNGCCVQKLTMQDESQLRIIFNKMSFTPHWKSRSAEVQKLVWPPYPRGWLRSARKKGGPLTTSICIYLLHKMVLFL